jgi:hypothetical protein
VPMQRNANRIDKTLMMFSARRDLARTLVIMAILFGFEVLRNMLWAGCAAVAGNVIQRPVVFGGSMARRMLSKKLAPCFQSYS